jgi:hypothetical protein
LVAFLCIGSIPISGSNKLKTNKIMRSIIAFISILLFMLLLFYIVFYPHKEECHFKTIELIQPDNHSLYRRDTLTIETIIENDSTLFLYTDKQITLILKK